MKCIYIVIRLCAVANMFFFSLSIAFGVQEYAGCQLQFGMSEIYCVSVWLHDVEVLRFCIGL